MPYASPRVVTSLAECDFYHTMVLPGYGLVQGAWDLRGLEAWYLGGVEVKGKRVLEIGTGSGFLCFYMERQGGEVVAFDLSEDHDWDVVPFSRIDYAHHLALRRDHIRRLNNGFWLAHHAFGSRSRVVYGAIYRLPEAIGRFHVATVGAVLLHCRDPFAALASVARLTDETVVVTEMLAAPELAGPTMQFLPDFATSAPVETWWRLPPEIVQRFLGVLGFEESTVVRFAAPYQGRPEALYTVVARRVRPALKASLKLAAEGPTKVKAGERYSFRLAVSNLGDSIWLSTPNHFGGFVTLGAHLYSQDNAVLDLDYGRGYLTRDIYPGEEQAVYISLVVPKEKGVYYVEFDMVLEMLCWFAQRGSQTLRITMEVV